MSIDQHVSVNLLVNNSGLSKQGFGTIAMVSYKEDLFDGNSSVSYTRLADALADGLVATSPEALFIARVLQPSPHVPLVKLIKGTRPPTQQYTLVVEDAIEGAVYSAKVKGEGVTATTVSYTALNADDEADIAGQLITQLQAVIGRNYAAVVDGSDPNMIVVTGTDPGDWFSIEVIRTDLIRTRQTHADPGIADDLGDVAVIDNDWYYLYTAYNSEDMVLSASGYVEAQSFKVYVPDFCDSEAENSALTADLAGQVAALTLKRTLPFYHRKPNEMFGAGVGGCLAPLNVGKWAAAYKTIVGTTADGFTGTQITHLDAKRCSYYKTEAGRNITWKGWVGDTQYGYFNTTVELDFVLDLIQKKAFGVLVSMGKIGFTDEDLAMIRGAIEGAIDICKSSDHRIVAPGIPGDPDDPVPQVLVPRVADIDPDERAAGNLPDIAISFRLQGTVLTVGVDLTVSF